MRRQNDAFLTVDPEIYGGQKAMRSECKWHVSASPPYSLPVHLSCGVVDLLLVYGRGKSSFMYKWAGGCIRDTCFFYAAAGCGSQHTCHEPEVGVLVSDVVLGSSTEVRGAASDDDG